MIIALLVLILVAILFPGFLRGVFLVLALVVLFAVGSAHKAGAAELPITDVEAACDWQAGAGRYAAYNYCVESEQRAYNRLRELWVSLDEDIQSKTVVMINKLSDEHNPFVYTNSFDYAAILLNQKQIRLEMNAPVRRFQP